MRYEEFQYRIESEAISMQEFMQRYHFEEKDRELLWAIGRFLTEWVTVQAGVVFEEERVVCGVTLGQQFDALENLIAQSHHLFLSFCVECYGMELLSKAYEKLNTSVHTVTGKWPGVYHFPEEKEYSKLECYGSYFQGMGLEWGKGMLRPLKSVVFLAPYREQKEEAACHDCINCGNVGCVFRRDML